VALGTFAASLTTVFWLIPREIGRGTEGKVRLDRRPLLKEFFMVVAPAVAVVLVANRFIPAGMPRLLVNALVVAVYLLASYLRLPASIRVVVGELTAKPLALLSRKGARR
jgi:hypothetical protein